MEQLGDLEFGTAGPWIPILSLSIICGSDRNLNDDNLNPLLFINARLNNSNVAYTLLVRSIATFRVIVEIDEHELLFPL
jgi:hypothetical protein